MKAIVLHAPGGLERLELVDIPDPGVPGPGEIRVRLHASSLNYHDYGVVSGRMPTEERRIPMSDGAGVVEAVGEGVTEFKAGDPVVSCFFPGWLEGPPPIGNFSTVPGDGVDGYAREAVVRPATWFTRAPEGFSHAEAATLTTAGLTAWRALVVNGGLKAGDVVLVLGTGGVSIFALQLAKAMGATIIATSSSDEKLERVRLWARVTRSTTASTRTGACVRGTGRADVASTMWWRSAGRVRSPSRSRRCGWAGTSR
jgi:NADPH:quinone reductase-like Zn-dependent oxidoreductase